MGQEIGDDLPLPPAPLRFSLASMLRSIGGRRSAIRRHYVALVVRAWLNIPCVWNFVGRIRSVVREPGVAQQGG